MTPRQPGRAPRPPGLPPRLLGVLLPGAERDEVLEDLADEHRRRTAEQGALAARLWLWRQVGRSLPSLLLRSWWRGWYGFEPRANRMQPGGPAMESWIMDLRFVLRRLRNRPLYALLAVLTLALGVGGTAAIFSIVRKLLLEPLPYAREEEVAVFWNPFDWSENEFLYMRPHFEGFREVAAYRGEDVTLQLGDGPPRLVPGISASAELFRVLGATPAAGAGFRPGDDQPGAEPVAVLSHGLWRELGGDPSVIGSRVQLDGVTRTVVGVMPAGFWFPDPSVRVWLAESVHPESRSGNYALVGRLAQGRTLQNMATPLANIAAMLDEEYDYPAQWDKTRDPRLTPIREYLVNPVRPALLATLAAMAMILLIACANVAALMLGQVDSRTSELSVRMALGAGRARLVRQIVAEALVVGLLSGAVGAALAGFSLSLLVGILPLGGLAEAVSLDWTVFWAAISIALVAAVGVGMVPGLSVWRANLQATLSRARTGGVGGRGGRLEGGLVVAEVALAVLMAAGAGLLIRSVANLSAIDPGVYTSAVAVVDVALPSDSDPARRRQVLREMVAELSELPGVRTAGAAQKLPLRGSGDSWGIEVVGRPELESSTTYVRLVTPDYFEALGIAVRQGRGFGPSDVAAGATVVLNPAQAADTLRGEPVVVINEALAQKYFPGEDPIGRRIRTGFGPGERIVGVVENVAEANLTDGPEPARYMLYDQVPYTPEGHSLVLRLEREGDAPVVLEAARAAVHRIAPGVAVQATTTMGQVFTQAVGPARQVMALLATLGGLALVLGAIGVYGIVSHFVSRQRRDWGIRLALGLRPRGVVSQVVGRGAALVGGGAVLGALVFFALARMLSSFLYGVGAADPVALAAAILVLFAVGTLAAYLPARRASRIDPAVVLREQ